MERRPGLLRLDICELNHFGRFSVSAAISLLKSAAVIGVAAAQVREPLLDRGVGGPALISRLSMSITSIGVLRGAPLLACRMHNRCVSFAEGRHVPAGSSMHTLAELHYSW